MSEYPPRLPISKIAWFLIVASSCAVFFGNLRYGRQALGVGWEDDFYYYSQVARNLAVHGVSTFDGIHLTNGYHPLWLGIITVVTKVFDVGGLLHSSTQLPFLIALETIQCLLVGAIASLVYKICRLYCDTTVSCSVQLFVVSVALILVRTGMEVGLTIALAFALLWFRLRPCFVWNSRGCFYYGLIASMMVLSRLDSILLVALLFFFDILPSASELQERVRRSLWFCIGMFPVAGYLLLNEVVFHVLMPVSGTAKQLGLHRLPSLHSLAGIVDFMTGPKHFVFGLGGALTLVGLVLLVTAKDSVEATRRGVFWAVILFPFVHCVTVLTMSDWNFWQWYLYAWPISGVIAMTMIVPLARREREAPSNRIELGFFGISVVVVIAFASFLVYASDPERDLTYVAALEIKQFAESHPGIYAMGDRSGAVGYLANVPVIQLEGLMMDKEYLDNIRQRRNVVDVLKNYNVRYYISTRTKPDAQGCYSVKEPWQAGPNSPAMYGMICKAPIKELSHGTFVNDIFDMEQ